MRSKRLVQAAVLMTLLALGLPSTVLAQGCPHGYMPLGGGQAGWSGCAPVVSANQPAPDPGPQWASRWGAIAADNTTMSVASVAEMSSKRKAQKAALKKCRQSGGTRACQVLLTYDNQCGVFVAGSTYATTYTAPDVETASSGAMKSCGDKTTNCAVMIADCSYPQRIR